MRLKASVEGSGLPQSMKKEVSAKDKKRGNEFSSSLSDLIWKDREREAY